MDFKNKIKEEDKIKSLKILEEELEKTKCPKDSARIQKAKRRIYQEIFKNSSYSKDVGSVLKNADIIEWIRDTGEYEYLLDRIRRKQVRTLSGISVVALMTSPEYCPHGTCIYCPGGPKENTPQSYTGLEPAARRGARNNYNSWLQAKDRISALNSIGHITDKIEVIIMGGTFTARPIEYQTEFVKGFLDAFNDKESASLEEAIKTNESAPNRCVGMTIETRPYNLTLSELQKTIDYGTTRVEIGVQILSDPILKYINRGHTLNDIIESTKNIKDAGLKLGYHIMPNLPKVSLDEDLNLFKKVFTDEQYRPDFLKIYPTLTMKGTGLWNLMKLGKYKSYDLDVLISLIADMLEQVPEYCRIHRIQRDIPAGQIVSGCKKSNLYEMVMFELDKRGTECRCIRCREAGYKSGNIGNPIMKQMKYQASGGEEIFLSFEGENDSIVSYLRLRLDAKATIREIRTVGTEIAINKKSNALQSRGYGKKLIIRAEQIAQDKGYSYLRVISGIGVREYYYKQGYVLDTEKDRGFVVKYFDKL